VLVADIAVHHVFELGDLTGDVRFLRLLHHTGAVNHHLEAEAFTLIAGESEPWRQAAERAIARGGAVGVIDAVLMADAGGVEHHIKLLFFVEGADIQLLHDERLRLTFARLGV